MEPLIIDIEKSGNSSNCNGSDNYNWGAVKIP
jgi:hypothetical protein